MAFEFYTCPAGAFKETDYIIDNGIWFVYEEVAPSTFERILRDMLSIEPIRRYMHNIRARGITEPKELVRHAARHFFAPLNHVDDITDDGTVNIEINK